MNNTFRPVFLDQVYIHAASFFIAFSYFKEVRLKESWNSRRPSRQQQLWMKVKTHLHPLWLKFVVHKSPTCSMAELQTRLHV